MSRGSLLTGPAALVVVIFFFVPWITTSCQGQTITTLSGREVAQGTTVEVQPIPGGPTTETEIDPQRRLFIVPLAAVVAIVLVALVAMRVVRAPMAGLIAAVLAVASLIVLLDRLLYLQDQADQNGFDVSYRYGVIGTSLACAVLFVGGVLDLFTGWSARTVGQSAAGPPSGRPPPE